MKTHHPPIFEVHSLSNEYILPYTLTNPHSHFKDIILLVQIIDKKPLKI